MIANPKAIIPISIPGPASKRSRFLNFVQIGAILLIVGAHTRVRGTQVAQVALELFFVIAGRNMARYADRYETLAPFVWSRARRLLPEISVVWCVALIAFLAGRSGAGVGVFLVTTPLFLENFAEPYLRPVPGVDLVFLAALWFAAALLQLQVIVFLMRKVFTRYHPLLLMSATVSVGIVFAGLVAAFHGGVTRNLAYASSDTIYRMAITHASPFVFGFMLGRGVLPNFGRLFPTLATITAAMGILNYRLAGSDIAITSCGFPVEMPLNFQYLWGYPLVALLLASFCAPDGIIARVVERVKIGRRLDHIADRLARLTYGVYVFHGLCLAALKYELWSYGIVETAYVRLLLFAVVGCAAFAGAWLFQQGWQWLRCRVCDGYPMLVRSTPMQIPPRCIACRHVA